ncbi:1-phosphofructokinase family hexose kinase, partial [Pseudomonas sp. 34 E 7]
MARILTLTLNPALDLTVRLARLEPGAVNRSETLITHAAGKGVNVAQVLADLGHAVTVGGFLGEDNPQAFEALIAHRGFGDAFVRVPGETRSNIKIAEQDGRVTDINAPGPLVSEQAQAELLKRLALIGPDFDAVVVAGSLPRGVSPQWFQALIEQLKNLGLKVALDTSGEALRAGLKAGPWMVKPNTEELAQALDNATDAIRQLHQQGVEHVVVSDGAAGVSWYSSGATL